MESPLGPLLANAFLTHHKQKWLGSCPLEYRPLYYRHYVDDIFLLDHFLMISKLFKF